MHQPAAAGSTYGNSSASKLQTTNSPRNCYLYGDEKCYNQAIIMAARQMGHSTSICFRNFNYGEQIEIWQRIQAVDQINQATSRPLNHSPIIIDQLKLIERLEEGLMITNDLRYFLARVSFIGQSDFCSANNTTLVFLNLFSNF